MVARRLPDGVARIASFNVDLSVAKGVAALRTDEWVTEIGQAMTPVKVRVSNVAVEYEVKIGDLTRWLERSNGSPREMMERTRIKSILGMQP